MLKVNGVDGKLLKEVNASVKVKREVGGTFEIHDGMKQEYVISP